MLKEGKKWFDISICIHTHTQDSTISYTVDNAMILYDPNIP